MQAFGYLLIATLMGASCLYAATAATNDAHSPVEDIAALAKNAPMLTVAEGIFLMGTARTGHDLYSLDLPYDDTEQPQRRVWLDQFEIDRDEVSLGELLLWLSRQPLTFRRNSQTDRPHDDRPCRAAGHSPVGRHSTSPGPRPPSFVAHRANGSRPKPSGKRPHEERRESLSLGAQTSH